VNFEGSISIHAPASEVWQCLLDPKCLADCTPGVSELTQVDDRTFRGTLSASVGPLSGKFQFESTVLESYPERELVVEVRGTDSVTASTITADTRIELTSPGPRSTDMAYRSSVNITGRLAILGDMVLRTTAMLVLEEFSRRLRHKLEAAAPEAADV
jgi:uncharacterized protein